MFKSIKWKYFWKITWNTDWYLFLERFWFVAFRKRVNYCCFPNCWYFRITYKIVYYNREWCQKMTFYHFNKLWCNIVVIFASLEIWLMALKTSFSSIKVKLKLIFVSIDFGLRLWLWSVGEPPSDAKKLFNAFKCCSFQFQSEFFSFKTPNLSINFHLSFMSLQYSCSLLMFFYVLLINDKTLLNADLYHCLYNSLFGFFSSFSIFCSIHQSCEKLAKYTSGIVRMLEDPQK